MEEDLLNIGITSYQTLYDIINNVEPFSDLWHVVLKFQECYDIWCNSKSFIMLKTIGKCILTTDGNSRACFLFKHLFTYFIKNF